MDQPGKETAPITILMSGTSSASEEHCQGAEETEGAVDKKLTNPPCY